MTPFEQVNNAIKEALSDLPGAWVTETHRGWRVEFSDMHPIFVEVLD